jgi:hypothetical protein
MGDGVRRTHQPSITRPLKRNSQFPGAQESVIVGPPRKTSSSSGFRATSLSTRSLDVKRQRVLRMIRTILSAKPPSSPAPEAIWPS